MATVDFTVARYARTKGHGAASTRSSFVRTSGQDTITTAENIEVTTGNDLVLSSGEIFAVHSDVAIRVRFGGIAATTTTGHYIPAGLLWECEVEEPGTVSAVEAG